jgi:hypothetical protein
MTSSAISCTVRSLGLPTFTGRRSSLLISRLVGAGS